MALDVSRGEDGDGCLKCGSFGLYTERLPAKEFEAIARLPKGAVVTYAHATMLCDCSAGRALEASMKLDSDEGEPDR